MVRNLLEVLAPKKITTRSSSYGFETLSRPFETYAQEGFYLKLLEEEHPRLKLDNFTASSERNFAAATRDGFT
jgi:hypothetical protein